MNSSSMQLSRRHVQNPQARHSSTALLLLLPAELTPSSTQQAAHRGGKCGTCWLSTQTDKLLSVAVMSWVENCDKVVCQLQPLSRYGFYAIHCSRYCDTELLAYLWLAAPPVG
jgi:hypothetical protein